MSWFTGRSNGNGKHASMRKPLARSENLIVEDLDDEVLVYDEVDSRAHCLSGVAARVWRACDGEVGVADLAVTLDLDVESVQQALAELESNALLDGPVMSNGTTRRQFSISAVKAGAAAAALPAIYSVAVPAPAAAASPTPAGCAFYSSGSCDNCTKICGCCCCCESCSAFQPNCKLCYPSALCAGTNSVVADKCTNLSFGTCTSGGHCSATSRPPCAAGTLPGPGNNCCVPACSVSCVALNGAGNCGCATGVGQCPGLT